MDANDDRKLSREETGGLTAVEPGYVVVTRMIPVVMAADVGGQMLSEMDQDQNWQISRQDYLQYGEQQFKKAQEQAGGQLTTQSGQAQTGQTQTGQTQTSQAQSGQMQSGQAQSGQGQTPA